MEKQLKKHKPIHSFFLNSIFQGNMFYLVFDIKFSRNLKPKSFVLLLIAGFLSINFLVNDILIQKLFYYDPKEIQLPIIKEFFVFQRRFFKIDWLKRIFSSGNNINFVNESSYYSKELLMDAKINSFR